MPGWVAVGVLIADAVCCGVWVILSSFRRSLRDLQSSVAKLNKELEESKREIECLRSNQSQASPASTRTDVPGFEASGQLIEASKLEGVSQPVSCGAEGVLCEMPEANVGAFSKQADSLLNSPSEIRDAPLGKPIKHLVVTVGGDRWVTENLPKDDYRAPEYYAPSVFALISKPVGYRLSTGYHLLRDDDYADAGDEWSIFSTGYHLPQDGDYADAGVD